jgi:hypothetical protein
VADKPVFESPELDNAVLAVFCAVYEGKAYGITAEQEVASSVASISLSLLCSVLRILEGIVPDTPPPLSIFEGVKASMQSTQDYLRNLDSRTFRGPKKSFLKIGGPKK